MSVYDIAMVPIMTATGSYKISPGIPWDFPCLEEAQG